MTMVGAELLGQLQLLVGDVDRGHGAADDLRVLQREVAEAADAGDRHQLAGADAADLDRLVRGDARAGQRGGVDGVDAVGHRRREGRLGE